MPPHRPPPRDRTNLRLYKNFLYSKTLPFRCPYPSCLDSVLPKNYEKHCARVHHAQPLIHCVWCSGKVSWPKKCKSDYGHHLLACVRTFLNKQSLQRPVRTEVFHRSPLSQKRDLFRRFRDPQPRAYEPVWPLPLPPRQLTFDIDSLNWAASCVQMYLDLLDTTEWFHIIVRSVAYASFLRAMDADEGRSRTLPFWCWCDGGRYAEARHRQHRHMIAVAPRGHFHTHVWSQIHIPQHTRPEDHFRIIHKEPIQDAFHLVHTLGYVSQRKSICLFSGDKKNSPEKLNHYFIYESLPKDYRLVLVLLWHEGLRTWLDLAFQNIAWGELVRTPMTFRDHKWHFYVKNIPGILFGKILPLTQDLCPCDSPTGMVLHLLGERKLYFRRLNTASRFKEQITFYEVVAEDFWVPRPFQQRLINEFKPVIDRNRELEGNEVNLEEQLRKSERNRKTLIKANYTLHEENRKLKRELSEIKLKKKT